MKLKKINIENYRSIKTLSIETNDVSPIIFVGINETGKSNLLKAIALLSKDSKIKVDYIYDCNKKGQEAGEAISISGEFSLSNEEFKIISEYLKQLETTNGINESKIDLKQLETLHRSFVMNKDNRKNAPCFCISLFDEIEKTTPVYKSIKQKILEKLESFIKINFWEPSDNFLITSSIDLNTFKTNTSTSIPLRNMFYLIGKTTDSQILETIDLALSNPQKRYELEDKLSDAATKHINTIWKEHKIDIKVKTNANICDVNVYDRGQKYEAFLMQQRSDGFKQFVSLMLSISCQNQKNMVEDAIIVLDEPENHLHPSGVQYMRDELVRLGKNNTIFVSTHSIFLIDKSVQERHWIVEKNNKNCTEAFNVGKNKSVEDDEVMRRAFGIVYLQELLPENIYLVEGISDKNILEFMIKKITAGNNFHFAIKPAGGDNVPVYASMFMQDKVSIRVIVDSDEKGNSYIKKLEKQGFPMENAFTLQKLNSNIIDGATIEDLLPINFVEEFFENDEITNPNKININIFDKEPVFDSIVAQLNLKGDKNKEKRLQAKTRLANKFVSDFAQKSVEELKTSVLKLVNLTEKLVGLPPLVRQ